ncbi:helix-turn-helix transcriptional regulator [Cohnella mopanensis]|uniref:helix-turn-helix transcriptional regulator n=1 Tax=Cohnella mopanensis TaxID=2911966 RepID=UPI001EF7C51F|nr:helix-turn-helix domain-containing protein [Cohnella mopanensis]
MRDRNGDTVATNAYPPAKVQVQVSEMESHSLVEEAKELLQKKCGQGVCLKTIAKQLFVNPAYLGKLFKNYESISFNDYLVQVRMEKAEALLIETDLRIYEIAHEVGYRQLDWFYKNFKEYIGYSAKEYRSINAKSVKP